MVHRKISELSSSGLMSIESSHKLVRSGDTASNCFDLDPEKYQVGVIGANQVMPGIALQ